MLFNQRETYSIGYFLRYSQIDYRSEVLSYMNLLNEKHQLGLEAMKMQVVVFPGGVKFMKIMLKLSNFVMSEVVRRVNAVNMELV